VRRGKRYCGTHGHHWWANPHRVTATNRTASGQNRTVSFGIRTVNPGFYLPGIEVYSVLSLPRPCASYPSHTCVWVMLNRRAARRLHISASLYGRRRGKRRKATPSPRLRSLPSLSSVVVHGSSSISRLGPSSFASLVCKMRPFWKTRDIFCLPSLSFSFFPSVLRVLTGCPTNWIYRTVPLYRTPPLNVSLN